MQLTALVTLLPSAKYEVADVYYASSDGLFQISTNKNIIMFVLDCFSTSYLDEVIVQFPDVLDNFSDFTYFENCSATCFGTFFGMSTMIGEYYYDFDKPYNEYFDGIWTSPTTTDYYEQLSHAGYLRSIFASYTLFA